MQVSLTRRFALFFHRVGIDDGSLLYVELRQQELVHVYWQSGEIAGKETEKERRASRSERAASGRDGAEDGGGKGWGVNDVI